MVLRKILAMLYLCVIPCLVVAVSVGSCNTFRDWLIDKEIIQIGGLSEKEFQRTLSNFNIYGENERLAKKDIQRIYNKYWMGDDEGLGKKGLDSIYYRYSPILRGMHAR